MEIVFLQLSDIHIKTASDPALKRAEAIKNAVHEAAPNALACIGVVSGDVAYAGSQAQYEAALVFFEELRELLLRLPSIKLVEFVVVPGNHDCDFENESDIRQFLLRDVSTLYESDPDPTRDSVKALVEVQKNFFSFEAKLTNSKDLGSGEKLSWGRLVTVENHAILFQCFNTAWLSRKDEIQSKLFFPTEAIDMPTVDASLCASVFHHPYNWLDPGNYRALRDLVEQSSDFVFTGHEHIAGGGLHLPA